MSDKVQLLFEGHLAEAIGPYAFKIVEPFPIDGIKWTNENATSGMTLFMLKGKAVAYVMNDEGFFYLFNNKEKLGITWDESHDTVNPYCLGGVYIEYNPIVV